MLTIDEAAAAYKHAWKAYNVADDAMKKAQAVARDAVEAWDKARRTIEKAQGDLNIAAGGVSYYVE